MSKPSAVVSELRARGLINNITNESKLIEALDNGWGVYIGFDPSARSLHLGNYQQINVLRLFTRHGVPIAPLLGGATGMIGDPSGKSAERNLQDDQQLQANSTAISKQLTRLTSAQVLNNASFYEGMSVLAFLRDIGKSFSVNYMLEKEQVASRLETGISYTEFSYMLLQSYDFYCLYVDHRIAVQGGGSDQWGNITAGVDYIRKRLGEASLAAGMTFNLLTKSNGQKFGKSEKGALFLDEEMTSPYELYQFLLNQADEDMERLLKALTCLELSDIDQVMASHRTNPSLRPAQKLLAETIVTDVHGAKRLADARHISKLLFQGGDLHSVAISDLRGVARSLDPFQAEQSEYEIAELLVLLKACASKREARELVAAKAVAVNGTVVAPNSLHGIEQSFNREFSLIKKGKRSYYAVFWPKIGA